MTPQAVLVVDLEDRWLQLDPSLHYVGCSIEGSTMLLPVMPPPVLEGTKDFEVLIHSLMPSSGHCLHVRLPCVVATRSGAPSMRVSVATISNKHLSNPQSLIQTVSANGEIGPLTSRVRTIHPDNPSSLDADPNLIPESSMLELVGAPLAAPWSWFINQKVSAIHSDLADGAIVFHKPVLPFVTNLKRD